MKWSKTELYQHADEVLPFEERIQFGIGAFQHSDRLRDVRDVVVKGEGRYDSNCNRFVVNFSIQGTMVVPCAVTLEDVIVPLDTTATEVFSFEKTEDENEDVEVVKGDVIELFELVYQLILMEAPLKVVKPDLKEYPKGNGWEVIREEDYAAAKKSEIDPRLAKLKDYNPQ